MDFSGVGYAKQSGLENVWEIIGLDSIWMLGLFYLVIYVFSVINSEQWNNGCDLIDVYIKRIYKHI